MRILDGDKLRVIGPVPLDIFSPLQDRVRDLQESDWQPIKRPAGRHVLYFKYNAEAWNNGEYHYTGRPLAAAPFDDTVTYQTWHGWKDLIDPIVDVITAYFGVPAFMNKCFLNRLAPQGLLWPHWDDEPSMAVSKRIHLPVLTNGQVDFIIGDETFHLEQGTLVEIDNIAIHSVKNHSDQYRVHLVMDFYHPDFIKELIYGRRERLPGESNFTIAYTP